MIKKTFCVITSIKLKGYSNKPKQITNDIVLLKYSLDKKSNCKACLTKTFTKLFKILNKKSPTGSFLRRFSTFFKILKQFVNPAKNPQPHKHNTAAVKQK